MRRTVKGDILRADVEALVNTVNCVGFMGRGIAAQFKRSYPDNFKVYAKACKQGDVRPGAMLTVETGQLTNPRYIVNFPTKRHWRGKSRMEDIDAGLNALVEEVRAKNIRSIAVPPLGCGLGGLRWSDVRPRIEAAFESLPDVEVVIYEPSGPPPVSSVSKSKEVPNMTPGRAVLLGLMNRYLSGLMDPFVTLLELHKLMYFAQEAGEQLRLKFEKGPYGPYAENLRQVLNRIEGHYVTGYGDGGDDPCKQLELVPGAVADAMKLLETQQDTRARFERVAALLDGFETPFGMELLATVHWVVRAEGAEGADDIVGAVQRWNSRKQQFTRAQIEVAQERLQGQGWLS